MAFLAVSVLAKTRYKKCSEVTLRQVLQWLHVHNVHSITITLFLSQNTQNSRVQPVRIRRAKHQNWSYTHISIITCTCSHCIFIKASPTVYNYYKITNSIYFQNAMISYQYVLLFIWIVYLTILWPAPTFA